MKVIHINHSDINGGAARAAYRIHHCLRDAGIDSRMWVNQAQSGDWTVQGPLSKWEKLNAILRSCAGGQLKCMLKTDNPIIHSPAVIPSRWVKHINKSNADIVHLHWIAGEMLSIADLSYIQKPIIWTLHDMWAFCGAEHYTEEFRWQDGYRINNRPSYERGIDLNRWTWNRKRRHWKHPIQIVTPSQWLAECVKESVLMRNWSVNVVPNAIDTARWQPIERNLARSLFGLPTDVPLLLFGALKGGQDPRKGFDLLQEALNHLRGELPGLELVVYGQLPPREPPALGFPIHYTGHLHDDLTLRVLYNTADALVIPSRQDNLPNTGIEALACGTPVVAFDTGGLPDIVVHKRTGYLANSLDTEDLAAGIRWVLEKVHNESSGSMSLGDNARAHAVERFSYPVIAAQYLDVYKRAMAS